MNTMLRSWKRGLSPLALAVALCAPLAQGATQFKAESDGNLNDTNNWTAGLPNAQGNFNTLSNAPDRDLYVYLSGTFPGGNMGVSPNPQGKAIYIDLNGKAINAVGNVQHGFYSYRQVGIQVGCSNSLIVLSNGMYVGNGGGNLVFAPFEGLTGNASTNNEWRFSNVRADLNIIAVGLPLSGAAAESNRLVITDGSMVTVRQFVAVGTAANMTANRDKPYALYVKGGSWLMLRGTNALNIGGYAAALTPGRITYGGIVSIEETGSMLLVTNGTAYVGKWESLNYDADRCPANYCQLRVLNGGNAVIRDLQVGYGGLTNQLIRTNNSLLVSGTGSFLNVVNFMGVGMYTNARLNRADVNDAGVLAVTNDSNSAMLGVSNGTLTISSGGTAIVDRLDVYEVGALKLFHGRLEIGSGAVAPPIAVGDGTNRAECAVKGALTMAKPLEILKYSALCGVGELLAPVITNRGEIFAGMHPDEVGALRITAPANTWEAGASLSVDIQDAVGAPGTGFDRVNISGSLNIAATSAEKLTIRLVEVGASGFDGRLSYDWPVVQAGAGIVADGNACAVDNSRFHPGASGVFSVRVTNGNMLAVHYEKPPESPPNAPVLKNASEIWGWSFKASWVPGGGGVVNNFLLDVSTNQLFASFVGGYRAYDLGSLTSCTVTGLIPGMTYYYRLAASNLLGISSYSLTGRVDLPKPPLLGSPTCEAVLSDSALLGAEILDIGGASATERGVYWSATAGFTPPGEGNRLAETGIFGLGAFRLAVGGLQVNTQVYFKAFAANAGGTNYTAQAAFTTGPAAPLALPATNVLTASFCANWRPAPGMAYTEYFLDVAMDPNFAGLVGNFSNRSVGAATTFSVAGLEGSTVYYYRLRGRNGNGGSTNSETITVWTVNQSCQWTSVVNGVFSDTANWLNGLVPSAEKSAWFLPTNGVTVFFDGSKTNLRANFCNGTANPFTLGMGADTVWFLTNIAADASVPGGGQNETGPSTYSGWLRQTNGTVIINPAGSGRQTLSVGQGKTGILEINGGVMIVLDGAVQIGRSNCAESVFSKLILTNGATFQKLGAYGGLTLGNSAGTGGGGSNTLLVVDRSSAFFTSVAHAPLRVGVGGSSSNVVDVRNYGLLQVVSANPSAIGQTTANNLARGGPSNLLRVTSGGRLFVTNSVAASPALLIVDTNNTLFIQGGTVTVDRIFSPGYVSLASGKLVLKSIATNLFAYGLTVPAGASLDAQGIILSTSTVSGVLAPGGVSRAGRIEFADAFSMKTGSTLDVDLYYEKSNLFDQVIVGATETNPYAFDCTIRFNTNVNYRGLDQGVYCIITNPSATLQGTIAVSNLPAGWTTDSSKSYFALVNTNMPQRGFILRATAGFGGSIGPAGDVFVPEGADQPFTIAPSNECFALGPVRANGQVAATPPGGASLYVYVWSNVIAPGTVTATIVTRMTANSTPYWWLAQHRLTNGGVSFEAAAAGDPDGDTFNSGNEYVTGTDPTNAGSYFHVGAQRAGAAEQLAWTTIAQRIYRVMGTTNLVAGGWTQAQAFTNPAAGALTYTDAMTNRFRGFKVGVAFTNP